MMSTSKILPSYQSCPLVGNDEIGTGLAVNSRGFQLLALRPYVSKSPVVYRLVVLVVIPEDANTPRGSLRSISPPLVCEMDIVPLLLIDALIYGIFELLMAVARSATEPVAVVTIFPVVVYPDAPGIVTAALIVPVVENVVLGLVITVDPAEDLVYALNTAFIFVPVP